MNGHLPVVTDHDYCLFKGVEEAGFPTLQLYVTISNASQTNVWITVLPRVGMMEVHVGMSLRYVPRKGLEMNM